MQYHVYFTTNLNIRQQMEASCIQTQQKTLSKLRWKKKEHYR